MSETREKVKGLSPSFAKIIDELMSSVGTAKKTTEAVDKVEGRFRKSLPAVLDEMDTNIRNAMEAARRAEQAGRLAKQAADSATKASEESAKRAVDARKAAEIAASDATLAAANMAAKAERAALKARDAAIVAADKAEQAVKAASSAIFDFKQASEEAAKKAQDASTKAIAVAESTRQKILDSEKVLLSRIHSVEETLKNHESSSHGPLIKSCTLWDIGKDYKVLYPITIVLEETGDETIASFPELEVFATGSGEAEAISGLKNEIKTLYIELFNTPDAQLGKIPRAWKRVLNKVIARVGKS